MGKRLHYQITGREKQPIELMRLGLTYEEFQGYCIGNVMKYILRYKWKDGESDLLKAKEYIDFLLRAYQSEPILGDEE